MNNNTATSLQYPYLEMRDGRYFVWLDEQSSFDQNILIGNWPRNIFCYLQNGVVTAIVQFFVEEGYTIDETGHGFKFDALFPHGDMRPEFFEELGLVDVATMQNETTLVYLEDIALRQDIRWVGVNDGRQYFIAMGVASEGPQLPLVPFVGNGMDATSKPLGYEELVALTEAEPDKTTLVIDVDQVVDQFLIDSEYFDRGIRVMTLQYSQVAERILALSGSDN